MTQQPDSTPTDEEVALKQRWSKMPLFKRIVAEMAKPAKAVKVFPRKKR